MKWRALRHVRKGARIAAAWAGWHGRPDFMIIGAQKAGTSALDHYLNLHPQLFGCGGKELHFFAPEIKRDWAGDHRSEHFRLLEEQFARAQGEDWALEWYHAQFPLPRRRNRRLLFESTPDYLYCRQAPGRIRAYRPDMKFIVLLRDPVERAYSAWNMFRSQMNDPESAFRRERRSFEEAVREELERLARRPDEPGSDYVRRGFYQGLWRYFRHFPRRQFLILESSALRHRTRETLDEVCRFLRVSPFPADVELPPVFEGVYEAEMDPATRELLIRLYTPTNRSLFALLGETYDWEMAEDEQPGTSTEIRPAPPPRAGRLA